MLVDTKSVKYGDWKNLDDILLHGPGVGMNYAAQSLYKEVW